MSSGVLQRLGHLHADLRHAPGERPLRVGQRPRCAARPRPRRAGARVRLWTLVGIPCGAVFGQASGVELTLPQGTGHTGGRTVEHRRLARALCLGGAEATQFGEDAVEGLAVDVLHDVVMSAVVLAHGEDRHDVAVVQPRRRLGLALEAFDVAGVAQRSRRQHLQRHAPAQGLLLGLVDDPPCRPGRSPARCGTRPGAPACRRSPDSPQHRPRCAGRAERLPS
jgi:hypothetical protein